ncbi:MAG: noncanonical pyrimidine nucleotidase, YjjG family [Acidimicrobiaceae bacterium]|nr:noncanonical pyrimidine nucleotidase, YjjG family [Acidimicrobiaceae bacterium]|tara:strand:- start:13867 stop:14547 length:681 start_codon:yes stop_codon:yes gene_type:complete
MGYEVALFDLDLTLFDSELSERVALSASLNRYEIETSDHLLETYRCINSQLWSDFEKKAITLPKLRVERFQQLCDELNFQINAEELAEEYETNLGESGGLYYDAEKLLSNVKRKSKVGLITNGLESVQKARLSNFNLNKYFDAILISGECGMSKPDPSIFQASLDLLGHSQKDSVLMIGDSLTSDIAGAKNFGIDSCWYNPQGLDTPLAHSPTFIVNSLLEIDLLI